MPLLKRHEPTGLLSSVTTMPSTNVMIDLETLGVTAGAIILSLGAVIFDRDGVTSTDENQFHAVINRASAEAIGLVAEEDTVKWWEGQSPDARELLHQTEDFATSYPLEEVLSYFSTWLFINNAVGAPIWSNGAGFDFPILAFAYKAAGWNSLPWDYGSQRDYRTLYKMLPHNVRPEATGVHHDALDDAISQAKHASKLLKELYDLSP